MNKEKIRLTQRILNAFENDSGSANTEYEPIYLYYDGNNNRRQVTLARGFTEDGGALKKVLNRYMDKQGEQSEYFKSKVSQIGKGTLDDDKEFLSKLSRAGKEQVMKDAQDEIFEEVYMGPALRWAEKYGFKESLSQAVIVDTYLHSGGMQDYLMNRFPEAKPASGGNEKVWIKQYLDVRRDWLKNHSKTILRSTVYRPDFFLTQVKRNNWNLDCPMAAHDVSVC
jgi:chitosanase